jgi:hypothetical protein
VKESFRNCSAPDEKLLDLCAQPFGAEFTILRVLTKSFQLEESAVS